MILSKRAALSLAGVATVAVVGTAGVAAATAPDPSGTPAAPTASADPGSTTPGKTTPDTRTPGQAGERRAKLKHRVLARGMHGEWVVKGKDGKPVTLVTVRGEVTAVSATSITVKADDGFTATYAVGSETRIRGKEVDAIGDVKTGVRAAMVGVKSGDSVTARAVLVRT